MTMRAIWNDTVLAESDDTVVIEGNHYFPRESLVEEYFSQSEARSVCPWKGTAFYYTITVDGVTNPDAAWEYPNPSPRARDIKDRVAFWRGVEVVADSRDDAGDADVSGQQAAR
jgi:uncharacterized protein (DUF427 family)